MRPIPAAVILLIVGCLAAGDGARAAPEQGPSSGDASPEFDPLLWNIRMSPRSLRPPAGTIKETWVLDGYRLGRLGPDAPRAAIIDDDHHRRLLILSASDDGGVHLYRVADLPIEVGAKLPALLKNAQSRECRHQRMNPEGELGCLALSLLEALRE